MNKNILCGAAPGKHCLLEPLSNVLSTQEQPQGPERELTSARVTWTLVWHPPLQSSPSPPSPFCCSFCHPPTPAFLPPPPAWQCLAFSYLSTLPDLCVLHWERFQAVESLSTAVLALSHSQAMVNVRIVQGFCSLLEKDELLPCCHSLPASKVVGIFPTLLPVLSGGC